MGAGLLRRGIRFSSGAAQDGCAEARALVQEARALAGRQKYDEAAAALDEAADKAQTAGDAEGRMQALAERGKMHLLDMARAEAEGHAAPPQSAERAEAAFRAALQLAAGQPRLELELHLAGLLAMQGRDAEAEGLLQGAAEEARAAGVGWELLYRAKEAHIAILERQGPSGVPRVHAVCEETLALLGLVPEEQRRETQQAVLMTALKAAEQGARLEDAAAYGRRLAACCTDAEQLCSARTLQGFVEMALTERLQAEGDYAGDMGLASAQAAAELARGPGVQPETRLQALLLLARVSALLPAQHQAVPALLGECGALAEEAGDPPSRAAVRLAAASFAAARGEREEAAAEYEAALAADPAAAPGQREAVCSELCQLYAALGCDDQFERTFLELAKLAQEGGGAPDRVWEVPVFLADWYLQRGRADAALQACQTAVARLREVLAAPLPGLRLLEDGGAGPYPVLLRTALSAAAAARMDEARQRELGQQLVLEAARHRDQLPGAEPACLSVLSQFERTAAGPA